MGEERPAARVGFGSVVEVAVPAKPSRLKRIVQHVRGWPWIAIYAVLSIGVSAWGVFELRSGLARVANTVQMK